MGKPTEEELSQALKAAGKMRELGKDPYNVAKALLNLNYRVEYLERVLTAADRYIKMGQSIQEHRALVAAIKEAKAIDARTGGEDQDPFL